jgi:hypothetical protein
VGQISRGQSDTFPIKRWQSENGIYHRRGKCNSPLKIISTHPFFLKKFSVQISGILIVLFVWSIFHVSIIEELSFIDLLCMPSSFN